MTIALKAVAANPGSPRRTLSRLLKNRFATTNGIGLVGMMMGQRLVGHEVGALIVSRSVAQTLPNLTNLATETSLRVCTRCLDEGALPYFLQFPVFKCCPVHGAPLLEACPSCGLATPPYRLAPINLDVAMACRGCRRPFSEPWAASAFQLDWDPNHYACEAHRQVHANLHDLNSSYCPLNWGRAGTWFSDIDATDLQATVMAYAAHEIVPGSIVPMSDRAKTLSLRTCSCQSRWEVRQNESSLVRLTDVARIRRRIERLSSQTSLEMPVPSHRSTSAAGLGEDVDTYESNRLGWADALAKELWRTQLWQIAKDIQRQMPYLAMASWYPVEEMRSPRPYFDSALPLTCGEWGRVARWVLLCHIEAARHLYFPEHELGEDCRAWLNYARRSQANACGLLAGSDMAAFASVRGQRCGTHLVCASPH